jgi:tripeptide aminopeptidase
MPARITANKSGPESTSRLVDLAIAIQQIPAPTFQETRRADFVQARFSEEGLPVERDAAGNVLACWYGAGRARPALVSAHLDTVFPSSVDLAIRREPGRILGPGLGDNSVGVAGLFGLLWRLRERKFIPPGDLWLVANVCEEGLGDLRGIRAVVDRFGSEPLAYLVLEGLALGQVYHRGLGVRRYRIRIRTAGGHSWIDYGKPSAIHELTGLSSRLTGLELPRLPRTSLNIGTIVGGLSVNTIASEASLELDLRSEGPQELERLVRAVEKLAQETEGPGIAVSLEPIGQRPAGEIPANHPLVRRAVLSLQKQGLLPHLNIGSTDANLALSRGLPAVTIGLTTGGKAHTVHEFVNLTLLGKGLEQLAGLVQSLWEESGPT